MNTAPTRVMAAIAVGKSACSPRPTAQQIYERLYKEVYLRMYRQLKPLYQSIRKITGYPA